jgi:hypothetical protein
MAPSYAPPDASVRWVRVAEMPLPTRHLAVRWVSVK